MQGPRSSTATLSRMRGRALLVTLALFAARSAWAQAPAGRVYVPIAPCRIVDTLSPSPNPLVANITRTFNVVGSTSDFAGQGGKAGGCGIPGFLGPSLPQVQAVMFNFVAVGAAGAGDGGGAGWLPWGPGSGEGGSVGGGGYGSSSLTSVNLPLDERAPRPYIALAFEISELKSSIVGL